MTHRRGVVVEARAVKARPHERPGPDPGLALLLTAVAVFLALALGTVLFLLLPAAF